MGNGQTSPSKHKRKRVSFAPAEFPHSPSHKPQCSPKPLSLIDICDSRATYEELFGCFAVAEEHWRTAVALTSIHCPESVLLSRISHRFGLFLSRFLPASAQPLPYLRQSLRLERLFSPFSSQSRRGCLQLARCLVAADCCEEAESMLRHLLMDTRDAETLFAATTCRGWMLLRRGDVLKSEEVLRENATKVNHGIPHSEALGEALVQLSETLVCKEQFSDSEKNLTEAVSILKHTPLNPAFKPALRLLSVSCSKRNRYDEIEAVFESVLSSLQDSEAFPYTIAEVLIILGDAYRDCYPEQAASSYLKALAIFTSGKAKSWYVATVLAKLVHVFKATVTSTDRFWARGMRLTTAVQFAELTDKLKATSTVLSVALNEEMRSKDVTAKYARVVMALLREESDETVVGEMLLLLARLKKWKGPLADSLRGKIQAYIIENPVSRVAMKLHFALSEIVSEIDEKETALQRCIALQDSLKSHPSDRISALLRLSSLKEANICKLKPSADTQSCDSEECAQVVGCIEEAIAVGGESGHWCRVEALTQMAEFYSRRNDCEKWRQFMREAVEVASDINANSLTKAKLLIEMALRTEDMTCFAQGMDIYLRNGSTLLSVDSFVRESDRVRFDALINRTEIREIEVKMVRGISPQRPFQYFAIVGRYTFWLMSVNKLRQAENLLLSAIFYFQELNTSRRAVLTAQLDALEVYKRQKGVFFSDFANNHVARVAKLTEMLSEVSTARSKFSTVEARVLKLVCMPGRQDSLDIGRIRACYSTSLA